jgi:DNA-3-methyladenine glycosylase
MRARRGTASDRALCSGPGRLCQALAMNRGSLNGKMMPASPVVVTPAGPDLPFETEVTPRIGITKAADWPLRFMIAGSPWVSRRSFTPQ